MTTRSIVLALVLTSVCFVLGHPGQKGEEPTQAMLTKSGPLAPGQCSSDYDCYPGDCCVMSGYRFTIPTCQERRKLDEICRPEVNKIMNTTLTYPDGSKFYVKEAHYVVCPCKKGLVCGRKTGSCHQIHDDEQEEIEKFIKTNNISDEN